jgi:hypothetical protein
MRAVEHAFIAFRGLAQCGFTTEGIKRCLFAGRQGAAGDIAIGPDKLDDCWGVDGQFLKAPSDEFLKTEQAFQYSDDRIMREFYIATAGVPHGKDVGVQTSSLLPMNASVSQRQRRLHYEIPYSANIIDHIRAFVFSGTLQKHG